MIKLKKRKRHSLLMPQEKLKDALDKAKIDGKRRGETLSVEEFGQLSNILKQTFNLLPVVQL